jgi:Colicin immunity protein / pyocin immunity protein
MPQHLTRNELIELVGRIMRGEGDSQEEADRLVDLFVENVPHPEADDLIFYPEKVFGREPTAEEVVDAALSYRPIEL